MGSNRRQRRRDQRRRRQGGTFASAGPVRFTGIMGFFQRNIRIFFMVGIVVLILSLGGIFFTQLPQTSADPADDRSAPTETATPEATPEGTAEPTASATPDEQITRTYSAPPEMTIDPENEYEAIIHLASGDVRVELLPQEAPGYVNNFVFLARNRFYEGLTFHRVVPGFVAQGGDPAGTGSGGPGYWLEEEKNALTFEPGVLSMAKAGLQVSGSQFFITTGPAPHLNGEFTVFGRVVEGLDLLESLSERDPLDPSAPPGEEIMGIEIVERGG